jgi:predicted RNase H-like HicB family nuclease
MNPDTYSVIIFWSDDDSAFVARVPELPGCMAHGETRAIAIKQINIAIQNWLDTAREIGREIPNRPKHLIDYAKELDQAMEQTIKTALENATPSIVEALAKEIAKSGNDVSLIGQKHGIQWAIRQRQKEPSIK